MGRENAPILSGRLLFLTKLTALWKDTSVKARSSGWACDPA
jgi:hypothetical protein